ncbi:MAG: indole-3-glycerol-phosphate synthase [Candidatus Bathyarchaeia archaeon]
MADILDMIARHAKEDVKKGCYRVSRPPREEPASLKEAILRRRGRAIIAEVKGASPSLGVIRPSLEPEAVAEAMERGGAAAISVLTERRHFGGSLEALEKVRRGVRVPLLMKDFVVSAEQVEAASSLGADAILLIQAVFNRGYCDVSVEEMVELAHLKRLEVLLEAHREEEYLSSLNSEADLVGINNRDLATFKVDLDTTRRILKRCGSAGKPVVSESGIERPEDIRALRSVGVDAFLVGSSIMKATDIEAKVRELVAA